MKTLPAYTDVTKFPNRSLEEFLSENKYAQIAVLVDNNTKKYCYPAITLPDHLCIEIQAGESHKNLETCRLIWDQLTNAGFDRKGLLINIGGGVIGDMGGFAAACYKRGIEFINIPTTLLAQVDASIGGKLGVDFHGLKNHIGAFQLPGKVIIAPQFLKTLPTNELKSGFAEVIKHGLIYDAGHFHNLKSPELYTEEELFEIIKHSISMKNAVVEADPTEQGLRKILNFGHTIGHAIESIYLESDRPLLHGEAVAIGMICESYLSKQYGFITMDDLNLIVEKIDSIFPRMEVQLDADQFIERLRQDKKNKGKEILGALLKGIGSAEYDVVIKEDDAIGAIAYYTSS